MKKLHVVILYDDRSTHVGTVLEHLQAFSKYSRHDCYFLPATGRVPGVDGGGFRPDFSAFDAIIIHYSVRLSVDDHLSSGIADLLVNFDGPKALFIQDEYDCTETARRWIEHLGIDLVFTNVPMDQVELVYPRSRFPKVEFAPTLTGYVPETEQLDLYNLPIADRTVRIGYRGRKLPHQYGRLGHEKYIIGVEVKKRAQQAGVNADIEVSDLRRIYGLDWYRFMGSCRATLGTESGSNVFDDDGSIAGLATRHQEMPFAEFERRFLVGHEGPVMMNQVSPKIFEAIKLKTALVLFEGKYSGVVEAGRHYIPLKKDFSNIDEVFNKLEDVEFLEKLTARAHSEVIDSQCYSYAVFIADFDSRISSRCENGPRATIIKVPVLSTKGGTDRFHGLASGCPLLSDAILVAKNITREDFIKACMPAGNAYQVGGGGRLLGQLVERINGGREGPFRSAARMAWHLMPARLRSWLLTRI